MSAEHAAVPPPQASRDLRAAAVGPLANQVSPKYLEEHSLLPLGLAEDGSLLVAVGGPLDPAVADELRQTYGRRLTLVEAPAAEIQSAILSASNEAPSILGRDGDLELLAPEEEAIDDLRSLASQAPVIKLVNVILLEALRLRASDVHLESTAQGLRVRYRIDGVLQEVSNPPRQYQAAVISRIKIMASLNIAERRLAQDGRIRLRLSDRELDLRVSTLPALHGESVVLRILDRGAGVPDLAELGMSEAALAGFARLIRLPHGIILVTGPTGSGKTTTLYGALRRINEPGVKIVTVEDPVEYQIEGLTQIPVAAKGGLTFASALRSILRHDPDIIMVGEMRDAETAEISIQAALTGHLVFSTLHTNDAPGGITRLADMGVEPYLVAATVRGLLAQRLVRMVCDSCAEPYQPSAAELAQAAPVAGARAGEAHGGPERPTFRRGRGCDACAGSGYRGRTGIYELMNVSDEVRAGVVAGSPLDEIRALARRQGMVPLRQDGWTKVCSGITTIEELLRVTSEDQPQ
ncbi:MAG: Flp pilus assembly complex ATPase component TadA [Gemmatimonadales bacterium]|nr:Flp pilus assembly complex ATPase component TadA [Gemmatimonadales bacterium]